MLKFISLGSGSSGNCYYLHNGKEGLMIDAGVGSRITKKHFDTYGLSLDTVRYMLITHDHADHVKSVGSLSKRYNLPVYATALVHKGIEHNLCVKKKIDPINVKTIEKNKALQLGDYKVTPFNVPHDSYDNVGYKIETGGVTFCLVTDCGYVTPEVAGAIAAADYLVLEANYDPFMLTAGSYPPPIKERVKSDSGHLSNEQCAEALVAYASERLKRVWLCHLSAENNHPELALKTVQLAVQMGCAVIPTVEVLKRTTPTGVYELK